MSCSRQKQIAGSSAADRGQMFKTKAKALRPRPKFWPRGLNISVFYLWWAWYLL